MSDKPNRATRELAAEMARRLDMSETMIYELSLSCLAIDYYALDQVLDTSSGLRARDYLEIVKQIPTDDRAETKVQIRVPERAVLNGPTTTPPADFARWRQTLND